MSTICILPRVERVGGVAGFRLKFEAGLRARGIAVTYDPADSCDAALILAGTSRLTELQRLRRRGVRLVQRLDGINWIQRARWSGLRYHLRAEYGNLLLRLIRAHLADRILYQSQFVRHWWEEWYGVARAPATVILNGVDLHTFSPEGPPDRPDDRVRILLLEGSLEGVWSGGLLHAAALGLQLASQRRVELLVAGATDQSTRRALAEFLQRLGHRIHLQKERVKIEDRPLEVVFAGIVPREHIPSLARSSHLLYSADVNSACPNAVIEALACGLPVVGFDTGALRELIGQEGGALVAYGGNPWRLEWPDIPALAQAAETVLNNLPQFRRGARARAEALLSLDRMMEAYLNVLLG